VPLPPLPTGVASRAAPSPQRIGVVARRRDSELLEQSARQPSLVPVRADPADPRLAVVKELLDERCLADPARSEDHGELTASRGRPSQQAVEQRELGCTSREVLVHPPSSPCRRRKSEVLRKRHPRSASHAAAGGDRRGTPQRLATATTPIWRPHPRNAD
jgi:hypothetical protein